MDEEKRGARNASASVSHEHHKESGKSFGSGEVCETGEDDELTDSDNSGISKIGISKVKHKNRR